MDLIVNVRPHGQGKVKQKWTPMDKGGEGSQNVQKMCGHHLWMAPCKAPFKNRISIQIKSII